MKMIVFLALMGLAKPALAEYDIGKAVADSLTQSHIEQQAREAGVPEKDIAFSRLYRNRAIQGKNEVWDKIWAEQQAREAGVPEKDIARSRLYESSGTLSPADAAMLDSMMKIFRDEK